MEPEGSQPVLPAIQNVVSTVNLGCKLDSKDIASHARNAEYNPKVCTGAKSEQESKIAARKFAHIIHKIGYQSQFLDFKIQNIVASCDMKFIIKLETLAVWHSKFCRYEPEDFPGLVYKMQKPKIILLIFVSGKMVITGAKFRKEIYEAFEQIYPVVQEHRKVIRK